MYNVVATDNHLRYSSSDHSAVLESFGRGPDYVHLRKMRDQGNCVEAVKADGVLEAPETNVTRIAQALADV